MKNFLAVLAIFALIFAACGDGNGDGGNDNDNNNAGNGGNSQATLKIQNESFSEITDVIWNNVSFGTIGSGKFVIKNIQPGQGYVRFKRTTSPIDAQTNEVIVVGSGEKKEFAINNNTLITNEQNTSETGTLGTLKVMPQITIKQGDTAIERYGVLDFGTVLLDTTRSRTFNIGNSGRANLLFNAVDGKSVTLTEDNASGFFSVTQQPFATMAIPPEGTADFVISFNPTAIGQNYNAVVKVSTNSESDADFYFRVRGNASDKPSIGDTGPGDGMVFFATGGQYLECSVDLGLYTWSAGETAATSHNGGGFSDWRLPTSGELDLMYQNLHKNGLGNFINDGYWSSTAGTSNSTNTKMIQNFSNSEITCFYSFNSYSGYSYMDVSPGEQGYALMTNSSFRIRAVRSFSQ